MRRTCIVTANDYAVLSNCRTFLRSQFDALRTYRMWIEEPGTRGQRRLLVEDRPELSGLQRRISATARGFLAGAGHFPITHPSSEDVG